MGTFSDQTGAERCTPTPKGTYLPVRGANSTSLPCPKGRRGVEGLRGGRGGLAGTGREGPWGAPNAASRYIWCPSSADGRPAPQGACGHRFTRSPPGAGSCIPCRERTDRRGWPSARPPRRSDSRTPSPARGSATGAAMQRCHAQPLTAHALCLPCPTGTYGNQTGMPECWKCPLEPSIGDGGRAVPHGLRAVRQRCRFAASRAMRARATRARSARATRTSARPTSCCAHAKHDWQRADSRLEVACGRGTRLVQDPELRVHVLRRARVAIRRDDDWRNAFGRVSRRASVGGTAGITNSV